MLFLLIFAVINYTYCEQVVVQTNKGTVLGQTQSNGTTSVFYGIPYANINEDKPFEDTKDQANFSAPFNATNSTIICPQVTRTVGGTLQCLTLNIFVPNDVKIKPIPVFVWFYGGGFIMGDANAYNPKHLIKKGVIVVTVNYRLGPYGFLCIDYKNINNQGLKDQVAALKWVRDNIDAFGGDPNKVTIGGQSYGGGAVDFLLRYKEKLFDKAIIQSGSKYAYGIVTEKDNNAPLRLANFLGSNANKTKDAIKFLYKVDPMLVMNATRNLGLRFGVCNSKEFSNNERIKDTPILIGFNSKEDFGGFATKDDDFYRNLGTLFNDTLAKIFKINGTTLKNVADIVQRFYLAGKSISKETMLELIDFSSDYKLNNAVERSVDDYLKYNNNKVYKYVFCYTGGSIYRNISGVGAYHTEELQYIFDMGSDKFNAEQLTILDRMTSFWTNFIIYGNPNLLKVDILPERWRPTDLVTRGYWNIDVNITVRTHVYHQRMAFWDLLWTFYGNK